ncbi:condensation domain-containing protein [Streptomyces sp. NBC_00690]|uniref:condensation domain-containing protein n=1 Tax=Streptomyces sp. NBC_00690 TaxID=2975808 RepID=UPI002E2B44C7|nr:condensation domain-containing protein [Streptomyces sp. NBC_00690]
MSHATLTPAPPQELTAAQAHVLSAQRTDPHHAGYNVGQYIELIGPVDVDALQDALRHTLAEAPGLHFRIREEGGRLLQEPVPFDAAHWRLPRLDTTGAADPTSAAVELVREQLACPPRLDLLFAAGTGTGPPALTGAVLVRVGAQHHLLFQYFHQLAVDGYGVALLTRRIAEVYTAVLRGTPLPDSPFAPVSTLVDAESRYTASAQYARDRAHWAARYGDGPQLTPVRGRSAPPSDTALRRTVVLDRQTAAAVVTTARASRCTWAETIAATVAVQLHRETGTRDVVLAMYAMARTAPGTLRVPGMTVNVLPVRVAVGDEDTFATVLERIAAEFTAVRTHQRFRGEEIVGELWPGRMDAHWPGPLLNLRPFDTEVDFAGVPGHIVTLASGPVDGLSISAVRYADGRLRLDFDGNPALYDAQGLAEQAEQCVGLLRQLCREPGRALSALRAPDVVETIAPRRSRAGLSVAKSPPSGNVAPEEAGGLPLLPVAHRLRESGAPVERRQESALWEVPAGLSAVVLRRAVARLARAHPALRLTLHRLGGAAGEVWTQEVLPSALAPAVIDTETVRRVVTGRARGAQLSALIAGEARRAALALDPWTGTVLRLVWFDAGPGGPGRLLLIAHVTVADDASWQVIVPELAASYQALLGGGGPIHGSGGGGGSVEANRTASEGLHSWTRRLLAEANGPERMAELPEWSALSARRGIALPPGPAHSFPTAAEGCHDELTTYVSDGSTGTKTSTDTDTDGARRGADAHGLEVAVLTALAVVSGDEPRLRGGGLGPGLVVEREFSDPARPTRMAGGFGVVHPVRIPSPGASLTREAVGQALSRTAGALASVPDGGRGHQQLLHLNAQTASLLADGARDVVRVVHRVRPGPTAGAVDWRPAPISECAALRAALAALPGAEPPVTGPLELTVVINGGSDPGPRAELRWRWAAHVFSEEEARRLTAELTELITHFLPFSADPALPA